MFAFFNKLLYNKTMIGDVLKKTIREKGYNQVSASKLLGVSVQCLNQWINNKRNPSIKDIENICEKLGISPSYLVLGESKADTIPVIGYVQAGLWQEATQWDQSDFKPIYMPTDERFKGKRIYALEIRGNSMNLIYPPGSCVVCVSVEDYYDVVGEISSGKKVVVQRKNPMDGTIEATVKQYAKNEYGIYLMPQSTDPSFSPIKVDDGCAGETKITGVVIGSFRKE